MATSSPSWNPCSPSTPTASTCLSSSCSPCTAPDAKQMHSRSTVAARDACGSSSVSRPEGRRGISEQRILRHDPSLDPPLAPVAPTFEHRVSAVRWVSRRRVLAIGAASALIAAALLAVAATRGGGTALMDLRPGVATIDEHSGRVLSSIGTNEISQPAGAVKGAGGFWIWSLNPFLLSQIDAKTGKVLRRIASPFSGDAGWYLPAGRSVWFVGTQDLVRVDAATGLEAARLSARARRSHARAHRNRARSRLALDREP